MARYVNRSRAAVICFGGWGLQSMLHLWPRVRFVQEERRILGIDHELPDLNKQTAFACVIPHPTLGQDDETSSPPLTVVRPKSGVYPPPYFVEELLRVFPVTEGDINSGRTSSEVWGRQLYDHAIKNKPVIEELAITAPFKGSDSFSMGNSWRQDMFSDGIAWAETTAKALLRYVIDPTRLDRIQTLDPHVQTNIYVVASLAEPRASALIWPIVSELVAALGNRNVARVIAFFSTGSFALDDTAAIEEAACYAALRELESLTGVSKVALDALQNRVFALGKPGWKDRVGLPLFDRIYLLDKEKSNGSLAQNSQELAVLTGNAIEAFLTADGATHLETRLGPDIDAESIQRRYSLIGAANDYVPLADYIDAAIRDEQKRIARTLVVPLDSEITVKASLNDLKAEPGTAVKELMRFGDLRMFENETTIKIESRRWRRRLENAWNRIRHREENASPMPDWLPELRIARSYLLPDFVSERLRQQRHPWQWHVEFNDHINALARNIEPELEGRRFARAWGIPYHYKTSASGLWNRLSNDPDELKEVDRQVSDELSTYQTKPWAMRWRNDQRVIPYAMFKALHETVDDVRSAPGGLLKADTRLKNWLEAIEAVIEELGDNAADPDDSEWSENYIANLDSFGQHYANAAGNFPQGAGIWARTILAGCLLTFFAFNWLLFELSLDLTQWQMLLVGLGCVGFTAILVGIVEGTARLRLRRLRSERVALAQERLSRNANRFLRTNLHRVYRRLREVLTGVQDEVDSTIESLRKWSDLEEGIHVLPLGIERSHLRVAHMNDEIWDRVKKHVQAEGGSSKNLTSEARFTASWTKDGSTDRLWYESGQSENDRLAQRVRLALEVSFNRLEMDEHIVELEAVRRSIQARLTQDATASAADHADMDNLVETVENDLRSHAWCGFLDNKGNCSACPNFDDCAFNVRESQSQSELAQPLSWSLHGVIRRYLKLSTEHLHPEGVIFPGNREAIQELIDTFGIEKLIIGSDDTLTEAVEQERRRDFVEESAARAKPSANSELAHPFDDSLIDIEFGVTPEGERSPLAPMLRERKISPLMSRDPTSITTVRTLNWLTLQDLLLQDRCRIEMIRLDDEDRKRLIILDRTHLETTVGNLYDLPESGDQDRYVRYQPIFS